MYIRPPDFSENGGLVPIERSAMQRSETGVTVNLDRDCWGTTVTGITRTVDVDLIGMECDCTMSDPRYPNKEVSVGVT